MSFPQQVARANVYITNRSGINVLGETGGSIAITAQNLDISRESLLTTGIATDLGFLEARAGNITLDAARAINYRCEPD